MSFAPLGLAPELLRAVADEGYVVPTPVQAESIPLVLDGRDVLAGAQTGTGKTAAFVLPILQRLSERRPAATRPAGSGAAHGSSTRAGRGAARPPIRCLILAPTRELAIQVEESVRTYGRHRPIRSTVIYGGVGYDAQVRALRAGPEIVVATPGRLLDHVGQRTIDLGQVEILVLDEADRMLDMGFIRDIRRVLELLPVRRQTLLFSATFSTEIRRLADGILDRPVHVQVTPRNTTVELVRQVVYPVDRERKRELLSHLIRSGRIDQALVFTRTKHGANRLAEQLVRDGIAAAAIHGNRSQSQRVRALADFKAGRVAILVATDIAARGIDIDSLPHVVNFELPMAPEDYVHRIGRTARAGLDGDAISLVCVDESKLLWQIESLLRTTIAVEVVEGFEPDRSIRPQPILLRQGAGRPPQPSRGHAPRPGRGPAPQRPNRPAFRRAPEAGRHAQPAAYRQPAGPRHQLADDRWSHAGPRDDRGPGRSAQRPGPSSRPAGQRPAGQRPAGPRPTGQRPPVALPGERLARHGGRSGEDLGEG